MQVGLVEDVTAATLERRRIEHERDYDVLTGLYNRRAFDARAKKLFRMPEKLGHAALLMMDMDNLKHINDTFGHDWGDRYINQTGRNPSGAEQAFRSNEGAHGASAERRHHAHQHFRRYRVVSGERQGSGYA